MENLATCHYKTIHFLILKEAILIRPIGVFTSLCVAIFMVTLRDRAHIFIKRTAIYENDMTQFIFNFSTRIKCEE